MYASATLYFGPAGALVAKIRNERELIARFEQGLAQRRQVEGALKERAAATLGATEEELDARLRNRLNEIAGGCGLSEVLVESNRPAEERNPAPARMKRSEFAQQLKAQRDFWVAEGGVTGVGSLDQALRSLATIQAQPWVHRIDAFSIKPKSRDRDVFEVRVQVATLMMPDLLGRDAAPPPLVTLGEAESTRWSSIVAKNVFKEPPPTAVAQAPAPPTPEPTPVAASPYSEWRLTGVVQSRLGIEAWLRNTRTSQTLALAVGGVVADARLVAAVGERAVFEIDGRKFEVVNGQTLEERRPLN